MAQRGYGEYNGYANLMKRENETEDTWEMSERESKLKPWRSPKDFFFDFHFIKKQFYNGNWISKEIIESLSELKLS